MSFRSKIAKINSLLAGETVSYSATWKANQESLIGVVPVGYADGYHRILSNQGEALVGGQKVKVVGRVCMDYVMVDLTELSASPAWAGRSLLDQEITFFGTDRNGVELPAFAVAEKAQTAAWEVLTSISQRVPRIYRSELA
jgi:alanine racemase